MQSKVIIFPESNVKSAKLVKMCRRQRIAGLTLLLVGVVAHFVQGEQHPATADEGPLSEVQTAVGLEVALPCDLMPGTMIADKVQLVIWYRQGNVKPIYTFDARGRPLHQAVPWADENVFKNKAHFYYDTNPPALRIKNIQTSDAGLYKCRVDFHKSPTRNWRINVTVLDAAARQTVHVPPTQLTILDHHGAAIRDQMAGPYLEGESINLTCLSSGGVPPPRVSWWREHALVDDSFHVLPDGTVRNVLHLKNIARRDLLTIYTCQATNGHVVAALTKKVILDMNLPPLSLLLQGLNHALVAGTRTHVTCTAVGARPPPQIVWTKGGQVLKGATQSTSSDGNTTVSELMLIPVPEDNERQVVCSISLNPSIRSQQLHEGDTTVLTTHGNGNMGLYLKDSRVLNVTHAPIVSLSLGAPLDPNNLMKDTDVYLECDVKANPGITRVEWYHNDKQLHSSRGIIISNQTLVLQGISKNSHGQYFCRATNIQGSVSSNEVYLDIKYPPVCKADATTIRAALKQTINITCQVDSNPLDNLNYKWHFNNSLENLVELPATAATAPAAMPLLLHPDASHASGGYYQRSKRKHGHAQKFVLGRHGRVAAAASVGTGAETWPNIRFEDEDELHDEYADSSDHEAAAAASTADQELSAADLPYTQMVYSNVIYKNHLDGKQQSQQHQLQQQQQGRMAGGTGAGHDALSHSNQFQLAERKRLAALHKQQHHRIPVTTTPPAPLNNVYSYHIESYDSFGAISCVASNAMGQSQACWYHIQPADLPDPVRNCTAYNATANSLQIQCTAGYDGGIPQHFHVQIYDELNRQILYNTSYKYAEFTVKRLPSDSVFVVRVTAVNAQGPSKAAYRLRGRTLSAPLLRTASSTAVLVQLTPLLGALLGVLATLVLVSICIVIFIKVRTKNTRRPNGDTTTTEADKGSAEPLSRNMGSHSSLEDKNPDVVPQETNSEDEFHLEEKAFDRLNIESQRILYTPPTRINTASPPPPSLSPTFGKQQAMSNPTTPVALMSQPSSEGDGSGIVPFECYGRNGDFQMAASFIEKLQALRYLLEADLLACDAKWTLFVAAALSYRYDTQLKPFPPRFVSEQTGFNIDALVSVINDTPKLRVVLQHIVEENYEEFDAEVMDLLHHVLVVLREPMLRLVDEDEFESLLRTMGQSDDAPRPTHVFEVTSPAVPRDTATAEESEEPLPPPSFAEQPLKLAFYGNKLDSFFSMLARGANHQSPYAENINSNNNNNNNGEQTTLLLTTDLMASLEHSPNGAGWGASACGSMISCVALCEFDNIPEFVDCKMSESGAPAAGIEVRNRDLVRVRYLLFYGSRFPEEKRARDRHMFSWIGRHKYSLSLACYMLLLASIGVANSGSGQYWKHLVSKKALMIMDFCKRIFTTD